MAAANCRCRQHHLCITLASESDDITHGHCCLRHNWFLTIQPRVPDSPIAAQRVTLIGAQRTDLRNNQPSAIGGDETRCINTNLHPAKPQYKSDAKQ
eukprot:scaffold13670_cov55-Cyclotella_meneghiniana.AAC.5